MPQVVFRSIFAMLFLWIGPMVWAETSVRLDLGESYVTDRGQGIEVQLRLNRATAYGLRLRDNPMRLIVNSAGVEAQNLPNGFDRADRAQAVTLGPAPRADWGRLSLNLTAPMVVERVVQGVLKRCVLPCGCAPQRRKNSQPISPQQAQINRPKR